MTRRGPVRSRLWLAITLPVALLGGPAVGAALASAPGSPPAACGVAPGAWPMFQGAPDHSADACSTINRSNVATLKKAWMFPTPGAVSATPAVAGGDVFVGDATGLFYALDQGAGSKKWTFDALSPQPCFLDQADPYTEKHQSGFGTFASSAAVATLDGETTVFVGGGGSLFALDAGTGKCLWAEDTDPAQPTSAIEIESSPVVDTSVSPPEVLVGNDDNSSSGIAVTGLMAFNAMTGALLWKYEPERDATLTPSGFCGSTALALSWGDGAAVSPPCTPTVPDLAPNSASFADACGDVWSSPALDTRFEDPDGENSFQGSASPPAGWSPRQITASGGASEDGLVVFGTGNCSASPNPSAAVAHGDYVDNQGVFALDPLTGVRVWDFVAPYDTYDNNPNEPWAGDDDFGSSAVLARVGSGSVPSAECRGNAGTTGIVVEGAKSGYAYGICEATGRKLWSVQAAQPGQLSQDLIGSAGGFIGSPALGSVNGAPTAFFTSAIPLPFSNDGIRMPGDGDSNISSCPGPGLSSLPAPPACPDPSIAGDPSRIVSLHAVDVATGRVVWQAPSLPAYGAASYTNGVVFDPQTTAFSVTAYDAGSGTPLWAYPLVAAPTSGVAVVGNSIFLGAGQALGSEAGQTLPPQQLGVWSFSL